MRNTAVFSLGLIGLLLSACDGGKNTTGSGGGGGDGGGGGAPSNCIAPSDDDQTVVQTALIEAKEGDTLCFQAGVFKFTAELSLDVNNVTLEGDPAGGTEFDFSAQDTGANGMLIKSDDVTLKTLRVRNTPGDGIRADSVNNITFSGVRVIWDAAESLDNGAYGLYPVNSNGVIIEGCEVKGARDAGIYVGQSQNIVVMNSEAHDCVAGIEIENSTDAEVLGNKAYDNSGGILIFNLPGLPVKDGKRAKVHDNIVENNNTKNFGEPGTTVSKVPRGIGIMRLATDDNEVHNNKITGNLSAGMLTVSYLDIVFDGYDDPDFNPFPEGNFIHDNEFKDNGTNPHPLIASAAQGLDPIPDIIWDGCVDPMAMGDMLVNCLMNNTNNGGPATYANADLCGSPPAIDQDTTGVTCEYPPLPEQAGK